MEKDPTQSLQEHYNQNEAQMRFTARHLGSPAEGGNIDLAREVIKQQFKDHLMEQRLKREITDDATRQAAELSQEIGAKQVEDEALFRQLNQEANQETPLPLNVTTSSETLTVDLGENTDPDSWAELNQEITTEMADEEAYLRDLRQDNSAGSL
jgi:hypothetical protein